MLFTPEELRAALRLLVAELANAGVEVRIKVVGAAAVTLQVGRDALTGDIDTLHAPSVGLDEVVARIAAAKNWPANWVNDAVKMFASNYDSDDDWEAYAEEGGVVVLVARPRLLLAMKLFAGRGHRDEADIDRLLDKCAIGSLQAARELLEHYYPDEVLKPAVLRQLQERFG